VEVPVLKDSEFAVFVCIYFLTLFLISFEMCFCTFLVTLGCGTTSSENCTYFDIASTINAGACTAKICKCNSNICQVS
jgi:hypothetical protein